MLYVVLLELWISIPEINHRVRTTTPQLFCLHTLAKYESMPLTDFSKTVNLGVSTVNGVIDRLEAKQYLTRERSSEERGLLS